MLSKTHSFAIHGLDGYPVTIEVDVTRGLPKTTIVGLPDSAIKESKERLRSAIKNSGYDYPMGRIVVNLSPANTKKEGSAFDLPMAIGILAASSQIPTLKLNDFFYLGELSLDGKLQPIKGSLPISLEIAKTKIKNLILSKYNAQEAALSEDTKVFEAQCLSDVVHHLSSEQSLQEIRINKEQLSNCEEIFDIDFSEVKGQYYVKRGLEIAAAGSHNSLLIGPPGSGKTMLAKRLSTILPNLTLEERIETTKIHSISGLLRNNQPIVSQRPFRSVHHTTSDVAIVGGGSYPKPGEVSLSHNGILYFDEFPEFNRDVLEALRQPLEDHHVVISRAQKSVRFPSRFMFIASMNPCPCGWYMDPKNKCQCSTTQISKYISKISGPLLDRIDIHLEVPALNSNQLIEHANEEKSKDIKLRTSQARALQTQRLNKENIKSNAYMNHKQIKKYCQLNTDCKKLLKAAIDDMGLSARGYDKTLKVARTIADLDKSENIKTDHIVEAIQYRCLDKNWFG